MMNPSLRWISSLCLGRPAAEFTFAALLMLGILAIPSMQAQTFSVQFTFSGTDGADPFSGLIMDARGTLYGTTGFGGLGAGTVFKLTKRHKQNVLHTFTGAPDGAFPMGELVRDSKGTLYGTTFNGGTGPCKGGSFGGCGTVFKVDTGGKETVLHSFNGLDGSNPSAGLIQDSEGALYGTTSNGGDPNCDPPYGCGTVFKLDKAGKETVLHYFAGYPTDGASPVAGLIRGIHGDLYGATSAGGSGPCATEYSSGCGAVFEVDAAGKETVLYNFSGGSDGATPYGLTRDSAGTLYGTTSFGGDLACFPPYGCGTVFKLDTLGKETALHVFHGSPDGAHPYAGVIRDAQGRIYGTTVDAGLGYGIVFEIDGSGKETVIYTFTGQTDGGYPSGLLALGPKGNLYGTARGNAFGKAPDGVVFKVIP